MCILYLVLYCLPAFYPRITSFLCQLLSQITGQVVYKWWLVIQSVSDTTINIIMPGNMFPVTFRGRILEFNIVLNILTWAKGNCIDRNKTMFKTMLKLWMFQQHITMQKYLSKTEKISLITVNMIIQKLHTFCPLTLVLSSPFQQFSKS